MESYKNLIVWQDSRRLNREIYNLVFKFPRFELYALSDQLRRACVSVTSNIAEGYGQGSLRIDSAIFIWCVALFMKPRRSYWWLLI